MSLLPCVPALPALIEDDHGVQPYVGRERYWSEEGLVIGKPVIAVTGRVEIVRSFTYRLNVGNFESRDFFCSQKAECGAEDAEQISDALYQFCKREVMRAVAAFKAEVKVAEDRDRQIVNERKAEMQHARLASVRPGG